MGTHPIFESDFDCLTEAICLAEHRPTLPAFAALKLIISLIELIWKRYDGSSANMEKLVMYTYRKISIQGNPVDLHLFDIMIREMLVMPLILWMVEISMEGKFG